MKTSSSSYLVLDPMALRNVGGFRLVLGRIWRMASSNSYFRKAAQQLSPAVSNFSCRMRFLSSLLKRRWLTAAYSFMKALVGGEGSILV